MNDDFSLQVFQKHLKDLESNFDKYLQRISVGRAQVSLLDGVIVEAYDTKMPLNQMATILVKDASTLQVTPFDTDQIDDICEAITNYDQLDLNPTDDGRIIYIPIPAVTMERRKQIIKNLQAQKEDFLIKLRQHRHHVLKQMNQADLSDDQIGRLSKQVNELTAQIKNNLETVAQAKIEEISNIS
ncbi:MAG: ribosome-recycling factor [Candidatus Saccharibacteria bacterium]|nr:ribosome-recycling factor [Candidatus Saccharibacteria bacterium]